jgi:RND superfamily putative drug exporter
VAVVLLVAYRAPLLALIPLVTVALALTVSLDLLTLLTQLSRLESLAGWRFELFAATRLLVIVTLFGAGTGFCLYLISRYKEELDRGSDSEQAVAQSVSCAGKVLVFCALSTVAGMAVTVFADFGKLRYLGPTVALSVVVALVACLTLAPALLRATGRAAFWPHRLLPVRRTDAAAAGAFERSWDRLADAVVRHPGAMLTGTIALLAPLAYYGLSVRTSYDVANEPDPRSASIRGAELVRHHFPAGEIAPLTVLAVKSDAHFDSADMEREIARLTKRLYSVEGVEAVHSLAEPTGDPPGYLQPFSASGLKKLAVREHRVTRAKFVTSVPDLAGDVARFDIVFNADPFSPAAIAMLDRLDQYLARQSADPKSAWRGATFMLVGTTSAVRDLARVTAADEARIQRLAVLAVLATLIIFLRRPWICLYLTLAVLLCYFASIGVTQWFFGWLYGSAFEGLNWKVPIYAFVILAAVGQHYNMILLARVLDEQECHGLIEGLRRALVGTGGVITLCGVVMAAACVSMTAGTLHSAVELGFALALGVLIDTFVVRPILVPGFLALVERSSEARKSNEQADNEQLQPTLAREPWVAKV